MRNKYFLSVNNVLRNANIVVAISLLTSSKENIRVRNQVKVTRQHTNTPIKTETKQHGHTYSYVHIYYTVQSQI